MSFTKKIQEDALIASGRHCCLCHKFCGTKIELHHIEQKKNGGKDTFDNCIPLCFDCHADIMTYNPDHPKGKKYSEKEVKRHRNQWYKKVENSPGIVTFDVNYLKLDKLTFNRLQELLDSKMFFLNIKRNVFVSGPFSDDICEIIWKYLLECELPDFEFIDVDLEGLRSRLRDELNQLSHLIQKHTFDASTTNKSRQSIPVEWQYDQPQRLEEAVNDFDRLVPKITQSYEDLIRLGRRKLFYDC